MITMPISEYPCSSDNISQAQNLGEKSGDINTQIQNIQDSNMPYHEKQRAISDLQSKKSDINKQINKKLADAHYEKKLDNKRILNKSFEKSALEEQTNSTSKLDKRA